MTIFFIGMPGSGKSTLGRLLADHLQLPFFDTDEIIADIEGKSVADIFDQHGEAHFRQLELELIENWKLTNVVVATGGGLPCHHDLINMLNAKGKTISVQVSIDELVKRLLDSPDQRPLLEGIRSSRELKTKLTLLSRERKQYYQQAQIRIKSEPQNELTLRRILSKIYAIKG